MCGAHSTVLGVTPDTHISANPQELREAVPGEAPADQEAEAPSSPVRWRCQELPADDGAEAQAPPEQEKGQQR